MRLNLGLIFSLIRVIFNTYMLTSYMVVSQNETRSIGEAITFQFSHSNFILDSRSTPRTYGR